MTNFISRCGTSGTGYRVAIKDNISVEGVTNTLGSAVFKDAPKEKVNAQVVNNLLQGNCQIIGKSNMHELAFGMTGVNEHFGTPTNKHYSDYMVGGSSSGSAAAVAAGEVDFSIGTDTGGSIRLPAACCGVYGFKPTFDRVSRLGVVPKKSSLDCVGPMAASINMIEVAMSVLDSGFVKANSSDNMIMAYLKVDSEQFIENRCIDALNHFDAQVEHIDIDKALFTAAFQAGVCLMNYEMAQEFGPVTDDPKLGEDIRARLLKAQSITDTEIESAISVGREFSALIDTLLSKYTVLALPTLPTLPLSRNDVLTGKADLSLSKLVRPFNLSGHPVVSMPLSGKSPISLQLVAAKHQDEQLCAIARELVTNCLHQFMENV